jgi:insertion element IS1 protein InsB
VLERIVDQEPFGLGRRQQDGIGRDKQRRWEPIGLEGIPDSERAGQMQCVVRPQRMRLHERIGLGHTRRRDCFSKSVQMHDIVIGLFVNRYAFGRAV